MLHAVLPIAHTNRTRNGKQQKLISKQLQFVRKRNHHNYDAIASQCFARTSFAINSRKTKVVPSAASGLTCLSFWPLFCIPDLDFRERSRIRNEDTCRKRAWGKCDAHTSLSKHLWHQLEQIRKTKINSICATDVFSAPIRPHIFRTNCFRDCFTSENICRLVIAVITASRMTNWINWIQYSPLFRVRNDSHLEKKRNIPKHSHIWRRQRSVTPLQFISCGTQRSPLGTLVCEEWYWNEMNTRFKSMPQIKINWKGSMVVTSFSLSGSRSICCSLFVQLPVRSNHFSYTRSRTRANFNLISSLFIIIRAAGALEVAVDGDPN